MSFNPNVHSIEETRQALLRVKDELAALTPVSGPPAGPADATFITQTPHAGLSAEQALSALATGILKSTTGTGIVSIAAADVDYALPNSFKGEFYIPFFELVTPVAIF